MVSLPIWHWLVVILALTSPSLGIARGVKNGAVFHAIISAFVPIYGLIYFFAATKKETLTR
jgi:ABC-type microcin C transport system permease subunit YejB